MLRGNQHLWLMPAPVLSVAQMRKWEKASWAAGRSEAEVISRVGHLVTARARQMTRPGDQIVVLAGKGHNGDDARHTSQYLNDREVYLINVTDRMRVGRVSIATLLAAGLSSMGCSGWLDRRRIAMDQLIEEITFGHPDLSIDTPSGLTRRRARSFKAARFAPRP